MKPNNKKFFLAGIPVWALALLAAVLSNIILFVFAAVFAQIEVFKENGESYAYIVYDIVIAITCFYICKNNPGSVWYVPVISNITGIIAAVIEPNFWITEMWVLICSGWALSLIGSFIGAYLGRRKHPTSAY